MSLYGVAVFASSAGFLLGYAVGKLRQDWRLTKMELFLQAQQDRIDILERELSEEKGWALLKEGNRYFKQREPE